MRYAIGVVTGLLLLAACKQELTRDKVELFAAIAYITWGMEEGNNKFSSERVDRNVLSDAVEYVVYSKRDGPAGMRMTIKSPRECVFTIGGVRTDGVLHTLDFNKATKLEFATSSVKGINAKTKRFFSYSSSVGQWLSKRTAQLPLEKCARLISLERAVQASPSKGSLPAPHQYS